MFSIPIPAYSIINQCSWVSWVSCFKYCPHTNFIFIILRVLKNISSSETWFDVRTKTFNTFASSLFLTLQWWPLPWSRMDNIFSGHMGHLFTGRKLADSLHTMWVLLHSLLPCSCFGTSGRTFLELVVTGRPCFKHRKFRIRKKKTPAQYHSMHQNRAEEINIPSIPFPLL